MNKQRRNRIAEALELISQARDILEEVKDEEQESYENLPESLQYGERGEQMQENVESGTYGKTESAAEREERQRMAAEALIVEDAYQRGYADAIADMRKKKEQRRQREQAKKARRWYFIKQKAYGLAMLAVTVLAVWATEGDITIAVITVPLGLMCLFSKKMLIVDNYYFATEERRQ